MGKIHDMIKAREQRLNMAKAHPAFAHHKPDTARELAALLEDIPKVRAGRDGSITAERHDCMYELAAKAKRFGLKGRWNLLCNRTQCLRPDAVWYNRGSYAFYCQACALDLNQVNRRDAEQMLGAGERLCVRVDTAEAAAELHVMP